ISSFADAQDKYRLSVISGQLSVKNFTRFAEASARRALALALPKGCLWQKPGLAAAASSQL
ncbi:MAG: hypothetical protein AAB221_14305, partial [Bacteroidota bacterium]